ncbi:MAG: hypothetical protein AB7O21_02610 [Gammaproteobacteria bacterium]
MRTLKQSLRFVMTGAVAALVLGSSGTAAADPPWERGYHRHAHRHHRCHDHPPQVVEHHYYPAHQQVVYAPPPQVVYAPPPRQVVYEQPVQYVNTYPQHGYQGGYYAANGNRLLSSAVLGAAGGFLGSQVGHGSGRAAATAAGAVAGWLLGGNLGR